MEVKIPVLGWAMFRGFRAYLEVCPGDQGKPKYTLDTLDTKAYRSIPSIPPASIPKYTEVFRSIPWIPKYTEYTGVYHGYRGIPKYTEYTIDTEACRSIPKYTLDTEAYRSIPSIPKCEVYPGYSSVLSFACSSPAGGMLFGVSGLLLLLLLLFYHMPVP